MDDGRRTAIQFGTANESNRENISEERPTTKALSFQPVTRSLLRTRALEGSWQTLARPCNRPNEGAKDAARDAGPGSEGPRPILTAR